MSCALQAGYSNDCRDSVGGLKNVYFIEFDNVASMTETEGVITALTKVATKRFWKYNLPRETGSMKSTIQPNEQNGSLYFLHELKIALNKLQTATRNEILLLAKNRLIAVGEDKNGKFWLLGKTGGIMLSGGEMGTGTSSGDRNGSDLEFKGEEKEPLVEVEATIAAALETPGT